MGKSFGNNHNIYMEYALQRDTEEFGVLDTTNHLEIINLIVLQSKKIGSL